MLNRPLQVVALLLCLVPACEGAGPEPVGVLGAAVVNGQPTTAYPEVGKLTVGSKLCTATLVGNKTVLTAAHCVVPGTTHYFKPEGQSFASASVHRHPSYGSLAKQYDLALVLLKDAPSITPAAINLTAPTAGLALTIVGYGKTGELSNDAGTKRVALNTASSVTSYQIKISGSSGGKGNVCNGDSGGPSFAMVGGKWVQVGIHSTKSGACGYGGNDVRVDVFASWIKSTANGDVKLGSGTMPPPPDPPTTPPPSGGGKQLCQPCTTSSECGGASDFCVKNSKGERFCTQDCSSTSCPAGYSCATVSGAFTGKQCIPAGSTCQGTSPPPPSGDTTAPKVTITSPADGASVSTAVTVQAKVTDDKGVSKAQLYVDGKLHSTVTKAPYSFPVTLAVGSRVLKVVGRDAAGNSGSDQVTVKVALSVKPTAPSPPRAGYYGDACDGPQDCLSGICALAEDGSSYCTQRCGPDAPCPSDAACRPSTTAWQVCGPPLDLDPPQGSLTDGGLAGGCSVAATPAPPLLTALVLLGLLARIRRAGALLLLLLVACDGVPRRRAASDGGWAHDTHVRIVPGGDATPADGALSPDAGAPDPDSKPPSVKPDTGSGFAPDGGGGKTCDPSFLGPFCTSGKNPTIIGFDTSPAKANPTKAEVRAYSFKALNHIRSRTCLPPLKSDSCLEGIAELALAANSGHGYFLANCMNAAHGYGKSCKCNWAQENIGASYGTGRTWKDGVRIPLCNMMQEPKGKGHRGNIESKTWKRVGVGIKFSTSGAAWFHEFGR